MAEFKKKFLDKLVDITTTLDGYRNQSIEESLPLVYNSLKRYFNKDNARAVTDKPRGLVTRYNNGSNTRND